MSPHAVQPGESPGSDHRVTKFFGIFRTLKDHTNLEVPLSFVRSLFMVAAVAILSATAIDARPHRVAQVPNGSLIGCALCHNSPSGGDARNAFGLTVQNGFLSGRDVVWGAELAAIDSDGDGATNGEELLDPDGSWAIGDDNPGDFANVTLPWDAESFPPPTSTAVTASTWATVKQALQELVD